jgi:ABC-type antimicrobial peptide transport system permease subunit
MGIAIATAVIFGALSLGESVKQSLNTKLQQKIGLGQYTLQANDRLFSTNLVSKLNKHGQFKTNGILQLGAMALNQGQSIQANKVTVYGITNAFNHIPLDKTDLNINSNKVAINQALAIKLSAVVGTQLLIKVDRPDYLPKDALLADRENMSISLNVQVAKILTAQQGGAFSLVTSQTPQLNVFVDQVWLGKQIELENKINLCVFTDVPEGNDTTTLFQTIHDQVQLTDLSMTFKQNSDYLEISTDRIFIDDALVKGLHLPHANKVFSYFVNSISANKIATPYSMVSSFSSNPFDLGPTEIAISQWQQDDLNVKIGDSIEIQYFIMNHKRELENHDITLTLKSVYANDHAFVNDTLMPNYPGISDSENCADWHPAMPMDLDAIRDKDEQYWDTYRGMPKAMIHFDTAQNIWGNPYGKVTAIRYDSKQTSKQIEAHLFKQFSLTSIGFNLTSLINNQANRVNQSLDLGMYFSCFSFFLIVSSIILITLLFKLMIDKRVTHIGTLVAVGISLKKIKQLFIFEAMGITLIGALLGVIVGLLYTRLLLNLLSTIWQASVNLESIALVVSAKTILISIAFSLCVALAVVLVILRNLLKLPPQDIMQERQKMTDVVLMNPKYKRSVWLSGLCLGTSILLLYYLTIPEKYFIAGIFVLTAFMLYIRIAIVKMYQRFNTDKLSIMKLVMQNLVTNMTQKMSVFALLALGSFMIFSVTAFHQTLTVDTSKRQSGTGGFALYGQSSLGIFENFNLAASKESFGLDTPVLNSVSYVLMRANHGDDASCLNLSRAQNPKLLGVNPDELSIRNAFKFGKTISETGSPWQLLNSKLPEGTIGAIGDTNTLMYGLHKKIGDDVVYTAENGKELRMRIVGMLNRSILQGSLIISESNFLKYFPSTAGFHECLIDGDINDLATITKALNYSLADTGLELTTTAARLAMFNSVENTYLSIFQILGCLGVLLGIGGIAIVFYRSMLARKYEFALLYAIGFNASRVTQIIFLEYWLLSLLAILIGVFASCIALSGMFINALSELPLMKLSTMLVVLILFTYVWVWLATRLAIRKISLHHLCNE